MLETIGTYTLLVMAVLMTAGGVLGFVKAKSKPSLIAGVVSGILLAACYSYAPVHLHHSLAAGALICLILCAVFAMRLKKTGKFMPSGMLLILNLLEVVFLCVVIVSSKQ